MCCLRRLESGVSLKQCFPTRFYFVALLKMVLGNTLWFPWKCLTAEMQSFYLCEGVQQFGGDFKDDSTLRWLLSKMLGKLQTNWKPPLSLKSQNHRIFWFGRDPQGLLSPNLKSVLTRWMYSVFQWFSHLDDTDAFLLQLELGFNERKVNTEFREGVLISEGKPQLLYIQVDNSHVILEVIHVKSQCLGVFLESIPFRRELMWTVELFTLLNHDYHMGCTGWLGVVDTSQLSFRLVYLQ